MRKLRREKQDLEETNDNLEEKIRSSNKAKFKLEDEKEDLDRQLKQV